MGPEYIRASDGAQGDALHWGTRVQCCSRPQGWSECQTGVTFEKSSLATACEWLHCAPTFYVTRFWHITPLQRLGYTCLQRVGGRTIWLVPSAVHTVPSGSGSAFQPDNSVILLSSRVFHHVRKSAAPSEWHWWLILGGCGSVFSEGWRFHSPFLTPHRMRKYQRALCRAFPSGSRSIGSMSALLLTDVSSLIRGWWYRWKSHDGNVSIHSPPSHPQPNQQNCWNNVVLLEWKRWLQSLSQMSEKPPSPCYIHKERLFTMKTSQVRLCKRDTVHKVTNESLGGDLSLLLAPSLGHFFTNCSLLARHTSFKSILFFFFFPLSLRNCILMDYFTVEILLISYAWFQGL